MLNSLPILADIGGIIWLVLVVGYWIFQSFTAAGQKEKAQRRAEEMKRAREARERETGGRPEDDSERRQRHIEDDLKDFLEQLSGQPAKPTPQEPPPVPVQTKPVIQFDDPVVADAYKPPPPVYDQTPEVKPHSKQETFEEHELHVYEEHDYKIEDVKDLVDIDYDAQAEESVNNMIQMNMMPVDLSALRYKEPRIKNRLASIKRAGVDKPQLRDPKKLKQALVAKILLDQPKALQSNPFEH